MNETIARLEQTVNHAPTELEKACSTSLLAWELRMVDASRAITLSDESMATIQALLTRNQLSQPEQFNAQTALALCLRTKAWCVYRLGDYDLAHRTAKQALLALRKTDDVEGESQAYLILGNAAWRLGDYDESLDAFNACIERARQVDNEQLEADATGNIGLVYQNLSDYRAALEYHQRALSIRQKIGDEQGQAALLANIGTVHYIIADYSSAMECYHRSLILAQELGDSRNEAVAESNIGNVYFSLGDYVSALDSYQRSLELFQSIQDQYGEASSLSNIGNIYEKLGDQSAALTHQADALLIFREIGYPLGEINALTAVGMLHERVRKPGQAMECYEQAVHLARRVGDRFAEADGIFHQACLMLDSAASFSSTEINTALSLLETALNIAERIDARELIYKSHQTLSEAFKKIGDYERALFHHELFYNVREAVFNTESDKRLRSMQIVHQLEQTRRESNLFQKQAEKLKQANDALSDILLEMERHKKHAEEQQSIAEEANRFKSYLLSIAAHDLRNPLSTIVTITDFIQSLLTSIRRGDSVNQISEVEGMLQLIHDSSSRMFKLIAQILQSSQIDSGKFQLNKCVMDLYPILLSIVRENISQATRKDQRIDFIGESGYLCEADLECMKEIFDNLISNAVKYSPKSKNITVKMEKINQCVRVSIKDEGQGLTEDDKKKLFGKFEKLSAKPTGGESSTGLGLSIVKQLVEMHNGRVWAESEGKHQGSTFFVELALLQP
jgi:signal transduction histidine kinase